MKSIVCHTCVEEKKDFHRFVKDFHRYRYCFSICRHASKYLERIVAA